MNKKRKLIIGIFVIAIIYSVMFVTKEITTQEMQEKCNFLNSKTHANVISAFLQNNQNLLLNISRSIVGNDIAHLGKDISLEVNLYENLCPNLNEEFRKSILDYYDEEINNSITQNIDKEKKDFLKGYKILLNFCNQ